MKSAGTDVSHKTVTMAINREVAKRFAEGMQTHTKTDAVDAHAVCPGNARMLWS